MNQHRRSPAALVRRRDHAQLKTIILAETYWDRDVREVVAKEAGGYTIVGANLRGYFAQGEVLMDARGRGSIPG